MRRCIEVLEPGRILGCVLLMCSICAVQHKLLWRRRLQSARETMTPTRALRFDSSPNNQTVKGRLNWQAAPVLMLFHVGAVVALFFFTWHALFVAIFLYWVTGGLGLGICYHRLLTHHSYATPKWFEDFLTICVVTALEGGPLLGESFHPYHTHFPRTE